MALVFVLHLGLHQGRLKFLGTGVTWSLSTLILGTGTGMVWRLNSAGMVDWSTFIHDLSVSPMLPHGMAASV